MLEPVHLQVIKKQESVKDSSHKLMLQERPMRITEQSSKLMRRKKMMKRRLRKMMRVIATIRNLNRV